MFCLVCGQKIDEGTRFCPNCGKGLAVENSMYRAQEPSDDPFKGQQGVYVTQNILLCADGKYRWMYELSMFSNPTIFITLCKVFAISIGVLFVLFAILGIISGNGLEGFLNQIKILMIVAGIIIGLILISYPIAALVTGGKYIAFFEMDEEKVVHYQASSQFSKSQAIGVMGMLAGTFSGNLSTFALGAYVSAVNSMSSSWNAVRSVKSIRKRDVIYVNELLYKNQVYAADEDFDFVENYIRSHCINAKIS